MPRKTKREKIIAEYRKKIKKLQFKTDSPDSNFAEKIFIDTKPAEKNNGPEIHLSTPSINDQRRINYFVTDMKKSIFLTLAIIALEILFYFATINNYLRLI